MVHYTNLGDRDGKYPPQAIAAVITKVNEDGTVALKCFYPTGIFDCDKIAFTEAAPATEEARGKWAWPPYVPATLPAPSAAAASPAADAK